MYAHKAIHVVPRSSDAGKLFTVLEKSDVGRNSHRYSPRHYILLHSNLSMQVSNPNITLGAPQPLLKAETCGTDVHPDHLRTTGRSAETSNPTV